MMRRKYTLNIIVILAFAIILSACSPKPVETESVEENALRLVEALNAGEYTKAYKEFNYETKLNLSLSPKVFEDLWGDLIKEYGQPEKIVEHDMNMTYDKTTVSVVLQHKEEQILVNVVYNDKNKIAGIDYGVMTENVEETKKEDDKKVESGIPVTVGTEKYPLKGLLTLPENHKAPYPLVILVPGSGPHDLDETTGANTPFKDIANQLAKKGIAVLRYNNRPYEYLDEVGKEIKDFTPYDEIIEDAVSAFEYAKTADKIDKDNIFILGHSIAGYFIPRISEYTKDSAGYIMLAANSSRLEDLIYRQYRYIMMLDNKLSFSEKFILARYKNMTKRVKKLEEGDNIRAKKMYGVHPKYWLYTKKYDAVQSAKDMTNNLLILQGNRDYQVSVHEFQVWKKALKGRNNVTFKLYENLNHLFMYGEATPTPEEYETKKTVDKRVTDDIANWVKEHMR